MTAVVTKDIDRGYEAAMREISRIKRGKPYVKVGLQSDAGAHKTDPKLTVVQIATFNEFGTTTKSGEVHVPERSFIRSTMDAERKGLLAKTKALFYKIAAGQMDSTRALGILGVLITSKIKRKITTLREPPNAPSTKRRKKSSNPLIDTGFMRQKVRHEVVE